MAKEKLLVWTLVLGGVCSLCTGIPIHSTQPNFSKGVLKIKRCPEEECLHLPCDRRGRMFSPHAGDLKGCTCRPCGSTATYNDVYQQPLSPSLDKQPTYTLPETHPHKSNPNTNAPSPSYPNTDSPIHPHQKANTHSQVHPLGSPKRQLNAEGSPRVPASTSQSYKDNHTGKPKSRRQRRSAANPTPSPGHWPVFPPQVGLGETPVNIEVPVPEYQRVVVDPRPDQANIFIIDPVPVLPAI